jgi:esterase/lipase superfamily enzyme
MDPAVARKLLDGSRVLVLIHGYNVDDAFDAYARIASQIDDLYDVVVGLSWPGSQYKLGYYFAEQRADKAGRLLADIFCDIPYESLDIEAHSCGCRLALEAVRSGLVVRNLILTGAALDNETVHRGGKYAGGLLENTNRGIIVFSRNDDVLKKAFRLSSFLKRLFTFKLGDDCKALGYGGAQSPKMLPWNVQQYDFTKYIPQHSAYKKSPELFKLWRKIAV